MAHYEQRLERDLSSIRRNVILLADKVIEALNSSVHSMVTGDETLAADVILRDGDINRSMRAIDAQCHAFIAVHLPSAGHLRLISSVIRINITLERLGDYAVTICRELVQIDSKPEGGVARAIELLAHESIGMLEQAVLSFKEDSADLAKATMSQAAQVKWTFEKVLPDLMKEQESRELMDLFALFVVFHHLVRVADQAKNVCEDVVFAVSGETKAKKNYKVLFVDEDNSCLGPMAERMANKSFAWGGTFHSAGRAPAPAYHAGMLAFMEDHGVEFSEAGAPVAIDLQHEALSVYHVIVSLQGRADSYIAKVPFHTTLVNWDVGEIPAEPVNEQSQQHFEGIYRELAVQIADLMRLLRGEEQA